MSLPGGCGRLFKAACVNAGILDKLAALPSETLVRCTHEYTLGNLRFAREADPDNHALADWQAHCEDLRQAGQPALPARWPGTRHQPISARAAARLGKLRKRITRWRRTMWQCLPPCANGKLVPVTA